VGSIPIARSNLSPIKLYGARKKRRIRDSIASHHSAQRRWLVRSSRYDALQVVPAATFSRRTSSDRFRTSASSSLIATQKIVIRDSQNKNLTRPIFDSLHQAAPINRIEGASRKRPIIQMKQTIHRTH
jgi:hypothetical protein